MIALLADHLWQSTLFALGVGLVTLALGRNGAAARYGLWLAASIKFLIPFALLAAAGEALAARLHLELVAPRAASPVASQAGMDWAPQLMAPATAFKTLPPAAAPHALALRIDPAPILVGAWALGLLLILGVWALRWSRIRAALKAASPVPIPTPIPALSSPAGLEPGVVGLWRPVLLLPEGIHERLTRAELDAVLAHELSHVRRKDNLTSAIHMAVQALFWFHPLVWWLGERLIAERERACDEAVVRAGHDRETYARGIIETCRLYLHSQLACVAGASGSVLAQRVDEIISRPLSEPLSPTAQAAMAVAGVLALATPLATGLLTPPVVTAPLKALVQAARRALPSVAPSAVQPAAPPSLDARPPALADPMEAPAQPTPVIPAATTGAAATEIAPAPLEAPVAEAEPTAQDAISTLALSPLAPPQRAQTISTADIRRQAYLFASSYGAATVRLDQLARWTQPVCVIVEGMPASAVAEVKGRVEQVASGLGLPAPRAGCKPNIQIMFTAEPQKLVDSVAEQHEQILGYWHHRDRDKLKAVTRPIQAWYVTGTGGGSGVIGDIRLGDTGESNSSRVDDEDTARGPTGCSDSHFTACLTSELLNVLVVVDTQKLDGQLLAPIADYVAMLALAQPRSLDSCGAIPSVIELFCPAGAGLTGLTRADAAYLTALYKTDLQARKATQQRDIADRMSAMLVKTEAARLAAQDPAAGTARR